MSVELELVVIQLVSDTDIKATATQQWTHRDFSHLPGGYCLKMTSQSVQYFVSCDIKMSRSLVGRVNALPILSAVDGRHRIGRQDWL